MTQISPQQVHDLAAAAGLELDDVRAETIASRLSGVLTELERIPIEALLEVEPAPTFFLQEEEPVD